MIEMNGHGIYLCVYMGIMSTVSSANGSTLLHVLYTVNTLSIYYMMPLLHNRQCCHLHPKGGGTQHLG